ncbi:MAG: LPP20 family lipoprotein [Pleomorphochaeta sp.]
MIKKLALLIVSVVLMMSCVITTSNEAMPSWFINQYDTNYSKLEYMVAVGSGDTKEEAEENAKISLSQSFNASIKNALVTYDNDTSSSLASRGYIDTSVDDLIGVNIVNTYINKDGVFFVRVAMNKQIAIDKTREILTPKSSEINSLLNKGGLSDYEYLRNLIRAQKLAISVKKYYDQLSVLENANVTSPLMSVENKIAEVKSNLTLEVLVNAKNCENANELKKVVETMLLESGVSVSGSDSILIVDYADDISNNSDGLYQCSFNLKVQLIDNDSVVFSINKDSRGIGVNESSARNKAMEKAAKLIEGELF